MPYRTRAKAPGMKRSLTLLAGLLPCWAATAKAAEAPQQPPNAAAASQSEASQPAGSQPEASQPEGSVSIAALLGYGFAGPGWPDDTNHFGVGYGVAAGYVFPSNVYLGGTVIGYRGVTGDTSQYDTFTLDLEFGAEFGAGPFSLRPTLGLGVLLAVTSSESGDDDGALRPQVVPALLAQYSLGSVRVGAEARYVVLASYPGSLSLLGSVGVAF
jgi:hypothetical protein